MVDAPTPRDALSVVMPVYNEEQVIAGVVEDVRRRVLDRLDDAHLIIVDDHSTDSTPKILEELARDDPRVKIDHAPVNRGHGPTLRRGLELASGAWIFHLDSDDEVPVEDFWKLWDRRDQADLVLGVRAPRGGPRHRVVLSRVVAATVSLLAGRRLRDPNVPCKLIRERAWRSVAPLIPGDAPAPSILLCLAASLRGWRIVQVPVTHRARRFGTSSLRQLRLFAFALRAAGGLATFRVRLRRQP